MLGELEAGGVGVGVVAEGGDDEVVEDADVEGFAGGFDAAGEGVVLGLGVEGAGGVVVDEGHGHGACV